MPVVTQASLESKLIECEVLKAGRDMPDGDAFGNGEDWVAEWGPHRVLLFAPLRQWYRWDRVHGNWRELGVEAGQALLVPLGRLLGAKKLPTPGKTAAGWYVYRVGDRLLGPVTRAELDGRIARGEVPADVLVWGAEMSQWAKASALATGAQGYSAEVLHQEAKPSPPPSPEVAQPAAQAPAARKFCPNCGTPATPGASFCAGCGTRVA